MIDRPGKIVCVGRNYAAHAREMGNEVPTYPLIFLKPPSSFIQSGEAIRRPAASKQVEHEGEIALLIGQRMRNVSESSAVDSVASVHPANDVTARDLQKLDGQWTRAKGFDTFCAVGEGVRINGIDLATLEVITRVNGVERQHGYTRDMIFTIPFLLAWISRVMTLESGDLILTGTPEGIGPMVAGDEVEVEIPGVGRTVNPVVDD